MIFIIYQMNNKIEFLKLRNGKNKIKSTVVEYRKEKSPLRNDFTLLEYPYVKIKDGINEDDFIVRKLRYASNFERSFKIGEETSTFYCNGDLLY